MLLESVIDPTREELDPRVFSGSVQTGYNLLPSVRSVILSMAREFQVYGSVEGVFLVGSILSYQWASHSDVDINVILTTDDEDRQQDAVAHAIASTDQRILPGTRHPLNPYITPEGWSPDAPDGCYDVLADQWIKGPYNISVDVAQYWEDFSQVVGDIDLAHGELRRDLVDWRLLTEFDGSGLLQLKQLAVEKMVEIDRGVKELAARYEELAQRRRDVFGGIPEPERLKQYQSLQRFPANVVYKLLERYHYSKLLRAIRRALRESGGAIDEPADVARVRRAVGNESAVAAIERAIDELTTTGAVGPYWKPIGTYRKRKKRKKRKRKKRA